MCVCSYLIVTFGYEKLAVSCGTMNGRGEGGKCIETKSIFQVGVYLHVYPTLHGNSKDCILHLHTLIIVDIRIRPNRS